MSSDFAWNQEQGLEKIGEPFWPRQPSVRKRKRKRKKKKKPENQRGF